ncbi:DUF2235 domain-containing protein [Bradyrhizobium sp. ISRA442]|uniref:DUF2235 domain-containing protein n=1 Tax=Bradyrhizobium sp. ISRA442 TaxID=2866197 RepID=UPI00311AEFC8
MKRFAKIVERVVGYSILIGMIVAVSAIVGQPQTSGGNQEAFSGPSNQRKRLAIFLDGTWNAVNSNTNVWRMRALCAPKDAAGMPQLIYYEVGVNGFLGGVFGKGLDENIRLAYEWLVENYNDGDEIFIFGFSRGAYTARSLAGLTAKLGILKPGSPIGITQLYDRYKRGNEETIWRLAELQSWGDLQNITTEERWLLKYSRRADVKMVGVWDTVGSLGLKAFSIEGISRSTFDFLETGLRIHILNGYHALAIDEHRGDFAPTLWDVRHPKDPKAVIAAPRPISGVEQRWFVGAHANVGGGYATDLLPQAPLRWIMKKAESQGLAFRSEVDLDGDGLSAPLADSYKEFADGLYSRITKPFYRTIGQEPDVRDDGAHVNVNETIDKSVFDRWRADASYRPKNLVEWADRKHVNPASLTNSVRADDPAVGAPD